MSDTMREQFIEAAARTIKLHRTAGDERGLYTTSQDREYAAIFYGMLIERNDCTVEEIVKAARSAYPESYCTICGHAPHAIDCTAPIAYTTENAQACGCTRRLFELDAFFRAITLEALGEGKVSDTFAKFRLPGGSCRRCDIPFGEFHYGSGDAIRCRADGSAHQFEPDVRPFSVPRLDIGAAS